MEHDRQAADEQLSGNTNIVETDSSRYMMESAPDGFVSQAEKSSESGQAATYQVLPGSVPNDVFVYRQDVVRCSKYEGLLGVVMEVAGDSDSDVSIMDDSDSDDEGDMNGGGGDGDGSNQGDNNNSDTEKTDSLPDGQVRVIWTDGSETTDNISDITVVDRGFLHGDFVASVSDPSGQMGLVLDVNISVDLLTSNGEVVKHVSSKDLKRIREFEVGDYVVLGQWLGRVDDVLDNVTVLFDDGSVCKVVKADPLRLQPVSKPVIDDAGCPYYPGQRVKAVSSSVFKSSRWLSGLWKANRLEGTVIKVQTASVVVYWMASAYLGISTNSSAVPSEEQNPKGLTLLDCFSYANWQLGDWCLLPSSAVADGTSRRSNFKKSVEDPDVWNSKDHSVGEYTDIKISSQAESSGQDLDGSDINKDHKLLEHPKPPEAVMDESVNSNGEYSMSKDTHENFQSERSDSMDLGKSTKLGESNGGDSHDVLPEAGSCSSSSSVTKETANESWPSYRRKLRKVLLKRDKKTRRRDETFERALFIVNTVTAVDVAWQDGKKEYGLESKHLIPIQNPSDHEFFPEQFVVEASNEVDDSSETKRVGLVRSVNSKEKTACVRWFKPVTRPEDSREFDCDEVVSAYELEEHPDYDYCYGDVVMRLSPVSVSADAVSLESAAKGNEHEADLMEAGEGSEKHSNHDQGEHLSKDEGCVDFTSLSWVGNITGLQDGDIEVTWADGMVSKVGPQAIYVVGRDDDGDSFDGGSEVSDGGASWETVDENEMDTLVTTEKEAELHSSNNSIPEREESNTISSDDDNLGHNGPLSVPLAALGFVTRLATGLFSRGRKQSNSDSIVANEPEVLKKILESVDKEACSKEISHVKSNALDSCSAQSGLEIAEEQSPVSKTGDADGEVVDDMDIAMPEGTRVDSRGADSQDDSCAFKHFDVVEDPSDHYYLGNSAQSTAEKKWVKKVQQEWSILEKNLPDAIYVRMFESRMDLLRAVIVGACGTPYQDGLFFFDFHLPPDYPQVPPSAYYHSGGLRLNPNLYADGKVCLSLLNTWTGKGNEVWDPSSSSILQVLVSLQGLVLNSKPYFNEAGYDKQVGTIEGEKNSLPYNENTYLLNLKSMIYLLRRPPMHFEDFVKDHFRQRGHFILKACETYMEGCLIGSLTNDACMTEKSKEHSCSVGFKLMLTKIMPRLISALTEVGVDCQQFEYLQKSENLPKN